MDSRIQENYSPEVQRFFAISKRVPKSEYYMLDNIVILDVKRYCGICRQHGLLMETRGHICGFKNCVCSKCSLVRSRRQVMSQQIRLRRAQDKRFQRTSDVAAADFIIPLGATHNFMQENSFKNENQYLDIEQENVDGSVILLDREKTNESNKEKVKMLAEDMHKRECLFANCKCEQCDLIETRRQLDQHIKKRRTDTNRRSKGINKKSTATDSLNEITQTSFNILNSKRSLINGNKSFSNSNLYESKNDFCNDVENVNSSSPNSLKQFTHTPVSPFTMDISSKILGNTTDLPTTSSNNSNILIDTANKILSSSPINNPASTNFLLTNLVENYTSLKGVLSQPQFNNCNFVPQSSSPSQQNDSQFFQKVFSQFLLNNLNGTSQISSCLQAEPIPEIPTLFSNPEKMQTAMLNELPQMNLLPTLVFQQQMMQQRLPMPITITNLQELNQLLALSALFTSQK